MSKEETKKEVTEEKKPTAVKAEVIEGKFGKKDKDGNCVKEFKCSKVNKTFKITTRIGK